MTSGSGWRVFGFGLASTLVVSGLVSSGASALAGPTVTRYAAPNGSGSTCTKSAPCDIVHAVNDAPAGADVVVLPGQYGTVAAPMTDDIQSPEPVTVHGLSNQPVPTIVSAAGAVLEDVGATVDHLRLVQVSDGVGLILTGASAHHVVVVGGSSAACEVDGTLSDSVCVSSADAAVETFATHSSVAATLRNVTAIGTGVATNGVMCKAEFPGAACQIQMVNTIAQGGQTGVDVEADAPSGASSNIIAFNSDIGSHGVSGSGSVDDDGNGNFDAPPVFVAPDRLDFHQRRNSPTVDTGLNSGAATSSDADGLPRILGKAVDVGAYEFPPPPAVSHVKITKRGKHSLHLTATVATQRLAALVRPVAHHGRISIRGKRKVLPGSTKAKRVKLVVKHLNAKTKYVVKVTVSGAGGTAADSARGHTRKAPK